MKQDLQKALRRQFDALTPLERRIARDIFGLNERRQKPIQELAAELGVDQAMVEEELSKLLRKLRSVRIDPPPRPRLPRSLLRRIVRNAANIALLTDIPPQRADVTNILN